MRDLFYNEKKCDGCAEIMHEDEDIVVCPECGTPQHRECYNKNNACVNVHLHAEGFDWKMANETVPEENPVQPENQSKIEVEPPVFAETNTVDFPNIPLPTFMADGVYVNGQLLQSDEAIDGVTVKEMVNYTQVNSKHYIKNFFKNKGKKSFLSWNWGAFFFTPAWFFYRKLYKLGAVFLAFTVAATIAVTPYLDIIEESYARIEPLRAELQQASETFSKEQTDANLENVARITDLILKESKTVMPYIFAVEFLTFILPCVAAALLANNFYRKKMLEDIHFAKSASQDSRIINYSLIRRGGVSVLAGLFALLAESYLPQFIMSVINGFIY